MKELSVLLVGMPDDDGLADRAAAVAESARVERVADLPAAEILLADTDTAIDLIVLAESRPGQFSAASIDRARRLAPLARVWRILGSWCEGEQRSSRPPAGCASSYWHQWRERAQREFTRARKGRCPAWGLPLTATVDERALAAMEATREKRSGTIAIRARRPEAAAALADACRAEGYETHVVLDGEPIVVRGATALVWDTTVQGARDAGRVEQLRRATDGAPIIALLGFPRPDDVCRALEAGVAAVISKPFLLGDLFLRVAECRPAPA